MKAGIGFCRRPLLGALAVGMLVMGTSAFGQEMFWLPIRTAPIGSPDATLGTPVNAPFNGTCWEYTADGGGFELTLDVRAQGWGNAMGNPVLGAIQATVLPGGYDNGVGSILVPKGWVVLGDGKAAFQAKNWCDPAFGGDGSPCNTGVFGPCAAGLCLFNDDWVMKAGSSDLPAIATPTLDFAWATAAQVFETVDPGVSKHLGGLILDVKAGAIGTYVIAIDDNINNSFMTAGDGTSIMVMTYTPACITLTTGSCCYEIGIGDGMCADTHTTVTCDTLAGTTGRVFRAGVTCAEENCPKCTSDAECDDGDACTDDSCNLATFICSNTLNYDPAEDCCDPGSGGLSRIDDDEQCTTDSCEESTGVVTNACNSGSCDDANDCTVRDTCDGICDPGDPDPDGPDRWCSGHDVNGDPCSTDADCDVGLCTAIGECECLLCTPLEIHISPGSAWDDNCFADGEIINAQIALGAGGSVDLFGGQFLLNYDESCVELLSVQSCPGSPFPAIIEWEAGGGTVWWASTTDPGDPQSTKGPDDIVCMEFRKLPGCDGCDMCFASINPRNTLLTNTTGNPVEQCIANNCSKVFRGRGVIDLVTPPDADINADCGVPTAIVEWDHPSASDSCDGPLDVTCVSEHDGGGNVDPLTWQGGEFPQGRSFFRCEATNSCHDTSVTVWTVRVSDQHGLHVEVELAGGMNPGMFWRAIDFQLYDRLCNDPTEICEVLTFGGPFNFSGHARGWLKVDKGNYSCISAKDPLHTLRSCAVIECVDNDWSATFKGDAVLGGNGLVGGNLDCWKDGGNGNTIDVLDAGVYLGIIARNDDDELWHDSHTSCGQAGPDGDINADGHTDSADYSFILENFLRASKVCCCPSEASVDVAITSITIKELRRRGFPELAAADINGDGVLDTEDMALYMEGQLPVIQVKSQKRLGSTR